LWLIYLREHVPVGCVKRKASPANITSIPGAKLEDHVDDYLSINKFRAAYEGSITSIPDKTMWPKATHSFFMHPPLLKSTRGRRKNRMKSEGGSKGNGKCNNPGI
jgi:hypothetical protein